jgi:hypothetical protein
MLKALGPDRHRLEMFEPSPREGAIYGSVLQPSSAKFDFFHFLPEPEECRFRSPLGSVWTYVAKRPCVGTRAGRARFQGFRATVPGRYAQFRGAQKIVHLGVEPIRSR